MKSLLASVRAGGGLDRVDHAVQWLEDEWRRHGDVPLDQLRHEHRRLLESASSDPVGVLAELIRTDLRCRFARGQTPTVASYLERFPELSGSDSRVLSLIYEEFCLIEERGAPIDVDSFCDRYGPWKESLVSQLRCHHLFSQAVRAMPTAAPVFPEPGDTFEEFRLVSLIGRGGSSRVFLARDLSLGGKQVVLKVSMDRGREPQAQGALDHPHIVPVNSVVFDDRQMRGLSMPFRPGLPLDEVIRRVDPGSCPRAAIAIWQALFRPPPLAGGDGATATPVICEPATGPRGDGWDGFPVRGPYVDGVAWIVKVVAQALHYAHTERTFHRDVKPANILLTLRHGPQLLDFNLAESPHSPSQAQAAMHGGTLPYMAPEQIEAFLEQQIEASVDPQLWGKVGARADLYSLGLVLRELLTGQPPDMPAETLSPQRAMRVLLSRRPMLDVSVRRVNPAIPHAMQAIVVRCLEVDPDNRYPDAGALAEDLDRFLRRRPLRYALNPSRTERFRNWTIRHRFQLAAASAFLLPVAFLFGMMAGRLSRQFGPPPVPIASSPEVREVLRLIHDGEALRALESLGSLASRYPESGLPRICLTLAYHACGQDGLARSHLEAAMQNPRLAPEMCRWNQEYPWLLSRLRGFADSQDESVARIRGSSSAPLAEASRDRVLRSISSASIAARGLAREMILATASAADPQQAPTAEDYQNALALERTQDYEEVYARSTRALAAIPLPSSRPGASFDIAAMERLERSRFGWSGLRARVATRLAEKLRADGGIPALNRALGLMAVAEKDLQTCKPFLTTWSKSLNDSCWTEGISVQANLVLSEVETDLKRLREAEGHLGKARQTFYSYASMYRQYNRKSFDEMKPVHDAWERRMAETAERLNSLRQAQPTASPSPVNRLTATRSGVAWAR